MLSLVKFRDNLGSGQGGFALLMVLFVVALLTILVTAFGSDTFSFVKRNRASTDSLEAEYAAQSGLALALSTLELPDDPSLPVRPWQILNSLPSLPIPGFAGELRAQIFDEGGKINLNSILSPQSGFSQIGAAGGIPPGSSIVGGDEQSATGSSPQNDISDFWKFAVAELFSNLGGGQGGSSLGRDSKRYAGSVSRDIVTLGGVVFSPQQQVAVLHDWIDSDVQAFSANNFPARGIEGSGNAAWFMNRPLSSLDELARVPGFTNEFLQRLSPYVRVGSSSDFRVNVNTAPPLVLQIIGFSQGEIRALLEKRAVQWLTAEELGALVQGAVNLSKITTVSSSNFKVIIRASSVSVTRWLEADCMVQSGFGRRIATVRKLRFY
ncbi:MAG TPA: type II secretion system protein GspK [Oligoflexia bacterium]|nr:type II secretion system protein GspK [Oligoflexia bacterium]HMP48911.1 type II secretion system protein GspK [Oligoflexia bacterium]